MEEFDNEYEDRDEYIKRLKEKYKNKKSSSDDDTSSEEDEKLDSTISEIDSESDHSKADDNQDEIVNENDSNEASDKEEKKKKGIFKIILSLFPFLKVILWYVVIMIAIVYIADEYILKPRIHKREILEMPNVVGINLKDAEEILKNKNLEYEVIKSQYNSKYKKDFVIWQKPKFRKMVREERPVYLIVSKGAEKLVMPNVEGMPMREARVKLINYGLEIGKIEYEFSEIIPQDTVISQSIRKGSKIQYGDRISIVVSKGSENMLSVPNLVGLPVEEIEDILSEYNLRLGVINYLPDETYQEGFVLEQFPPAGEKALKNSYVDIDVVKNPN